MVLIDFSGLIEEKGILARILLTSCWNISGTTQADYLFLHDLRLLHGLLDKKKVDSNYNSNKSKQAFNEWIRSILMHECFLLCLHM